MNETVGTILNDEVKKAEADSAKQNSLREIVLSDLRITDLSALDKEVDSSTSDAVREMIKRSISLVTAKPTDS